MPSKTPDILKSYFRNQRKPTEKEFGDLIDTLFSIGAQGALGKATPGAATTGTSDDVYMTPQTTKLAIETWARLIKLPNLKKDIENLKLIEDKLKADIIDGAPEGLNTFKKLAAALGNRTDFDGYIESQLPNKSNQTHTHDNLYYTQTEVNNLVASRQSSNIFLSGNIKEYLIAEYAGLIPDAFVKRTSASSYVARLTHNLGYKDYYVFLTPVSQTYTAYSAEPFVHIDKQNDYCDIEMRWRHQSSSGTSTWDTYDALEEGVEICMIGDPSKANNLNDNLSTITVDNTNNVVQLTFPKNLGGDRWLNYNSNNNMVTIYGSVKGVPGDSSGIESEIIGFIPEEYKAFRPNSSVLLLNEYYSYNNYFSEVSVNVDAHPNGNITITIQTVIEPNDTNEEGPSFSYNFTKDYPRP